MTDDAGYYLPVSDREHLTEQAQVIFGVVWRVDFTAAGFAVLEIAPRIDSHVLRSWMVDLKQRLNNVALRAGHNSEQFALLRGRNRETVERAPQVA